MMKIIEQAINKILAEEFREEALNLINLAPKVRIDELLQFYKDDNANCFCMCIDVIKYDLYKEGVIGRDDFPSFGEPFMSMD